MMLQNGLNKIRDLHAANIDKGWMGTDGSTVEETQTGLQSGESDSKLAVTITSQDKMNVINYTCDKDTAIGNTYREFAVILDGTVEYLRVTFTGIAHAANDDIVVRQSIFYRNP